jgi:hypothetical protein
LLDTQDHKWQRGNEPEGLIPVLGATNLLKLFVLSAVAEGIKPLKCCRVDNLRDV